MDWPDQSTRALFEIALERFGLAIVFVYAYGIGLACSQPLEFLATPAGRFEYVSSRVIGNSRPIQLRDSIARVKLVLLTCPTECFTADALRISIRGNVEHTSLNANPLASGSNKTSLDVQRITDEELSVFDWFVSQLPPESDPPPPIERRLVVAWPVEGTWMKRTYDRADLPERTKILLRAVVPLNYRKQFGAWVSHITPHGERAIGNPSITPRFAVSPDGQTLVQIGVNGLRVFDASLRQTHLLTLTFQDSVGHCEFSRDGRLFAYDWWRDRKIVVLDTREWKQIKEITQAQTSVRVRPFSFSSKGDFLNVWNENGPDTYNTSTWVTNVEPFLEGASWYWRSPNEAFALLLREDHSIRLWNGHQDKQIRQLADNCRCLTAAYSPDNRLVAVLTSSRELDDPQEAVVRLRIWNTEDGSLCSELLPYEFRWTLRVGENPILLQWTQDSECLLAASNPGGFDSSNCLHLWHVRSGRHCGDFVGAYSNLVGIGIGKDGKVVFAGDRTGAIFVWSLDRPSLPIAK
jgi:WD40 repeat protein